MTKSKRSVGVIGLGPAGLATVKELKNAGEFGVVTGFDRCSRVGGRWSLDRDTHDAGIWKELCANTTRRHMEFSDFPWNDDNDEDEENDKDEDNDEDEYEGRELAYAGIYPHCTETRAYLESYARKFDLYPHLRLETEVQSIEKVDNSSGGWKIITTTTSSTDPKSNSKTTTTTTTACHEFDAIVVCSGPQAKAYHPLESKLKDFTGSVIHSQQFQSEKDYKDQRVLVIGGNVSGSEIVSVLAEDNDDSTTATTTTTTTATETSCCQKVVHSVRKMPYHVQKFTKDGTSYDDTIFNRMSVWLDRVLPDPVVAKGLQMTILHYWPEQCATSTAASTTRSMPNCSVGVSPDIRNCGATVTKNYVEQVAKGHFDVKPEVGSVNGKRITFVDGTSEDFDVIICATGYDFDLSFLPESVQEQVRVVHPSTGKTVLALYKNTLVVPTDEKGGGLVDGLAFCGLINSLGPYFPQAELQARYIAAVWSGKIPRPGLSALRQNAEAALHKRLDTGSSSSKNNNNNNNVLNNFDTATIVNESLGDELGITPTLATAVCNPYKYLLGPIYACFYRTNGNAPDGDEEVAKRCRERFDRLIASSPQVRQ